MTSKARFEQLLQYPQFNAELGGIVGHLIGDSMGVPFEFQSPESLPERSQINMHPPIGYHRSHPNVPAGTFSDDGAQMLCLLASLLERNTFSVTDFSAKLLQWLDCGYMAVDGEVFDVGIQTEEALNRLRDGASPYESGGTSEMDNGNGSLMRVLPLALWHSGSDLALVQDAHLQSLPTHAHARSMASCGFYCLLARAYLHKLSDAWKWTDQRLEQIYHAWPDQKEGQVFMGELKVLRDFPVNHELHGTGYVIDTLWSAHTALKEKSFEDVVRTAILFGNDADTVSAVAAGLAGIKFGLSGIPKSWLEQLRGFELIEPLLPAFLEKMKANELQLRFHHQF